MSTTEAARLVTFRVGEELFAVDIFSVERVLRYEPARRVPHLPDWVVGVLEHAGRVVPVVDLRLRFGVEAPPPGAQARLLVLTAEGDWVGAIVDQVLDIRAVARSDIAPPPPMVRGIAGEFLLGVVRRERDLVVVLDVGRLFRATERRVLSEASVVAGVGDDGARAGTDG